MEHHHSIAGAPEVKITIRVRGMSHELRFFDEQTSTTRLTTDFIVIRLRERVGLDSELHVTNMRTQVGGTYRVAWINTHPENGWHSVGLELLDPEGQIWEPDSIPSGQDEGDSAPIVLLECKRCYQRISIPVPEAETESLCEGFIIARHCDTCRATTGWAYRVETPPTEESTRHAEGSPASEGMAPRDASPAKPAAPLIDHRQKGRAPIQLAIKVIRTRYGRAFYDICETINVSRTGVCFVTEQGYEVGETLQVILPYHQDSVAIPVPARVVRQDQRPGTLQKRVAIQLTPGSAPPS